MKFDSQFFEDDKIYESMIKDEYESKFIKKYESSPKKACNTEDSIYNHDELSVFIEKSFNSLIKEKGEGVNDMKVNALEYLNKEIPVDYQYFWINECPDDKKDWSLSRWEEEERNLKDFEADAFSKFKKTNTGKTISDICNAAMGRCLFVKREYRKIKNSDFYEDLDICQKAIKAFKEAIYYQPKVLKPLRTFKNFDKRIFLHISKAISNIPNLSKEQAVNTAVEIMWGISSGTLKDKVSNDEMKAIDIGIHLVKTGRWNRPAGMPVNG